MKNPLQDYMTNRINDNLSQPIKTQPGPVITVSRQAGCSCHKMSKKLAQELSKLTPGHEWNVISKDILHHTAEELKLHPQKVKTVFNVKDRTIFNEVIQAFLSTNYHLERKVRKTLKQVIRKFAVEGYNIIVGRGGNIIAADIEKSLHIRIDAPHDWRILRMMRLKKFTREEAINYLQKTEAERKNFSKEIKGRSVKCDDFDLVINSAKFNNDEVVNLILCALKNKKLI